MDIVRRLQKQDPQVIAAHVPHVMGTPSGVRGDDAHVSENLSATRKDAGRAQQPTCAKRSKGSSRSGSSHGNAAKRAKKEAPVEKADTLGHAGGTSAVQAQQKPQPPSVAELRVRVAALACRTGEAARQKSPQREQGRMIPVDVSGSDDESSLTTTPLSLRKTEERKTEDKKSSRSRSAISLRSRKATSPAPSRSWSRATAKRGESGSSSPSRRRGYLPSIARSSRSRSGANTRKHRSVSRPIAKERHYKKKDHKKGRRKKANKRARSNRRMKRSNTHGSDIRDRPGWDRQKPKKEERLSAAHREKMGTQIQRQELQVAANIERQERQVKRAVLPKEEAQQSEVTGAFARFITDTLTKKVGQKAWTMLSTQAQKAIQAAKEIDQRNELRRQQLQKANTVRRQYAGSMDKPNATFVKEARGAKGNAGCTRMDLYAQTGNKGRPAQSNNREFGSGNPTAGTSGRTSKKG